MYYVVVFPAVSHIPNFVDGAASPAGDAVSLTVDSGSISGMGIFQHVGVSPSGDDLISSRICGISRERCGAFCGDAASSPNFGTCDTTLYFCLVVTVRITNEE